MGASFATLTIKERDQVKARKIFADKQASDRYENGHSYSGGIGMANGISFLPDHPFTDVDAADDWLSDNAEKWEAALAVPILDAANKFLCWRVGAWCAS